MISLVFHTFHSCENATNDFMLYNSCMSEMLEECTLFAQQHAPGVMFRLDL